jgi:hypothetical protein
VILSVGGGNKMLRKRKEEEEAGKNFQEDVKGGGEGN